MARHRDKDELQRRIHGLGSFDVYYPWNFSKTFADSRPDLPFVPEATGLAVPYFTDLSKGNTKLGIKPFVTGAGTTLKAVLLNLGFTDVEAVNICANTISYGSPAQGKGNALKWVNFSLSKVTNDDLKLRSTLRVQLMFHNAPGKRLSLPRSITLVFDKQLAKPLF